MSEAAELLEVQARAFLTEPFPDLAEACNRLLQPHIATFTTEPAAVRSNDGAATTVFAAVVHVGNPRTQTEVPIDDVAAAIDAYETLNVAALEQAYERARELKSFKKTSQLESSETDGSNKDMTTFVVLARASALSLEEIAEAMSRLNSQGSSNFWPDMVAVLGKGVINYTARIPSEDRERGDFLLPSKALEPPAGAGIAPMYVTKTIRGFGVYTFNKVVAFIIPRTAIFRMGLKIGNHVDLLEGTTSFGAATDVYQFDLHAQLKTVPHLQMLEQYMPSHLFEIVVDQEKVLGSVQYQKWQDGAVVIVRGGFPLEIFLVFLTETVPGLKPDDLRFIRRQEFQISHVLPIAAQDFLRALHLFSMRSSNLTVRRHDEKFVVQKISNEGTQSPFVARLMLSVFTLRDTIFDSNKRQEFDKAYDPVLATLTSAREAARDLAELWRMHESRVASRTIVERDGSRVHITEDINRQLRRDLETFVNASARCMKQGMQHLMKQFGIDIGFLFKKDRAFATGLADMQVVDPILSAYLAHTRTWCELLMLVRNDMEHGIWRLQKVLYLVGDHNISAKEPEIRGEPLSALTQRMIDRVACFVEELTTYCVQRELPNGLAIYERPLAERSSESPERFRLTVVPGGKERWTLAAHNRPFEEA